MTRKQLVRARKKFNAHRRELRHNMAPVIGKTMFGRRVGRPMTFARFVADCSQERLYLLLRTYTRRPPKYTRPH